MEVSMSLAACCTIVWFVLDRIEANYRAKRGDQEDDAQEKQKPSARSALKDPDRIIRNLFELAA